MTLTLTDLSVEAFDRHTPDLCAILIACVRQGASIGFVDPFGQPGAEAFWQGLRPSLAAGTRRILLAFWQGQPVGTAQIDLDQPANGRHRAEIKKVLVHPAAQRRGIARQMMLALEEIARAEGRTLLLLDTRSGDSGEQLYRQLGYVLFGHVPGYATSPAGVPEACSFFWKGLT